MEYQLVTVLGARPQFVKAAMVSRAIRRRNREQTDGTIAETIVHTGQHFDRNMSAVFFAELEIPEPAHHLGIHGGSHGAMTARMLAALESVLLELTPQLVLVYGDTNSTLAGALAAAKLHIPVVHVEAGLRSFNRRMPEEVNRVVVDHLSEILVAPTRTAVENLLREGIEERTIYRLGDVMYDAALHFGERAQAQSAILEALGLASKEFVLATCHRAENTDDPVRLAAIWEGLNEVGRAIPVVLPLHPRTQQALDAIGLLRHGVDSGVRVTQPVGYLDLVMLEKHASLVVTDSGGMQKEAFFHGVPCVTIRDETEWVELVELGWNRLASPGSSAEIASAVRSALDSDPQPVPSPYGDGTTADRIVGVLGDYLLANR